MIPDDQLDVQRLLTALGRSTMQALHFKDATQVLGAEIERQRAQLHDRNIQIMALRERLDAAEKELATRNAHESTVDLDPIEEETRPTITTPKRGNEPLRI